MPTLREVCGGWSQISSLFRHIKLYRIYLFDLIMFTWMDDGLKWPLLLDQDMYF